MRIDIQAFSPQLIKNMYSNLTNPISRLILGSDFRTQHTVFAFFELKLMATPDTTLSHWWFILAIGIYLLAVYIKSWKYVLIPIPTNFPFPSNTIRG
jgi:hypothetical protein